MPAREAVFPGEIRQFGGKMPGLVNLNYFNRI